MAGVVGPGSIVAAGSNPTHCETCALRSMLGASQWSSEELEFIRTFKLRHGRAKAGTTLFEQGGTRPRLLTLFSGWALRSRTFASGEAQVLEVNLPGDLIGLSSVFSGMSPHWVTALTDVTFCEFDATRVYQLLAVDSLAYQVAWQEEIEARHIDERLASVGALETRNRVAFFFAELFNRLQKRQMTNGATFHSPLTREHIAQAVGTTRMHLNRVLRELERDGYLRLDKKTVFIADLPRLCSLGKLEARDETPPVL